jgi:serine/tyrosine/threonine adenylyltransferase
MTSTVQFIKHSDNIGMDITAIKDTDLAEKTPDAPTWAKALRLREGFAKLGEAFYSDVSSMPLSDPYLVGYSAACGNDITISRLSSKEYQSFSEVFSGNAPLPGTHSIATVYSGHQFGMWAGQLGDGRALLLGETANGYELQLKGAGLTPYSRMGDGRAVLRSSIREFLCSEAVAALGIATTRALCVVGSDAPVRREELETAAVVTRVARSFIRFGHFEHFAHHDQLPQLKALADYTIARYFPEIDDTPKKYAALLREVTLRTADLMAHWQAVGFCHGVMNTDNMSILGLTIDYGPFGFMEAFDPGYICNHSDHQGRYAYAKQPNIGFWNCYALGQALMPLIEDTDEALTALEPYKTRYPAQFNAHCAGKLGLVAHNSEKDRQLYQSLFEVMKESHVDFTRFFRSLSRLKIEDEKADANIRDQLINRESFDAWAATYRARLKQDGRSDAERALQMNKRNPKYVLRNYLAEVAIRNAKEKDFSEVTKLLKILEKPFDEQPEHEAYAQLPPDWASELEVSCSS